MATVSKPLGTQRDRRELRELESLVFGDLAGGAFAGDSDAGEAGDNSGDEAAGRREGVPADAGAGDDSGDAGEEEEEDADEDEAAATEGVLDAAERKKRKAVWRDEDEDDVQVNLATVNRLRKLRRAEGETVVTGKEFSARLREQFERMNPEPVWARAESRAAKRASASDADSSADEGADGAAAEGQSGADGLLQRAGPLLGSTSAAGNRYRRLREGTIDIERLKDANVHERAQATIQAVQFHPNGQLMLTASMDKRLRLFQVDGVHNPKVQSVYFADMPLFNARFSVGGDEVVCVGRRPFFYTLDLRSGTTTKVPGIQGRDERSWESMVTSPCGRYIVFLGNDGYIILVNAKTKRWIANLKMNGTARCADFSSDGETLYSLGSDGEVYWWDLRMRRCALRHVDEGSLRGTALAISPNSRYLACGSESGVVNVYDTRAPTFPKPRAPTGAAGGVSAKSLVGAVASVHAAPAAALMGLTTVADRIKFNPDGQVLAIASTDQRDALKLVHVPSFTTFANWPTEHTPLRYPFAMDFSPSSGYFVVGNDRGHVLLYRLNHYTTA